MTSERDFIYLDHAAATPLDARVPHSAPAADAKPAPAAARPAVDGRVLDGS